MDTVVSFNNTSNGRDKLARLLQYSCRTLWYILYKKKFSDDCIDKFKGLEYTFSTFRKLLRLGRFVDSLYLMVKSFQKNDGVGELETYAKFFHALFLFCDHIIWLDRMQIVEINTKKWTNTLNRCWLYSTVLNLLQDYFLLRNLFQRQRLNYTQNLFLWILFAYSTKENRKVLMDTLKNVCDFCIPLSSLGFVKLSPGAVGLLGVISSLAGINILMKTFSKSSS